MLMKRILGVMLFCCLPLSVFAQDAAIEEPGAAPVGRTTSLTLNQPYSSADIGELTFPFRWEVSAPSKDRVVATEPDSTAPAVIAVDVVRYPAELKADVVSKSIVNSMAEALKSTKIADEIVTRSTICRDAKKSSKCKNQVYEYTGTIAGKEQDVDMRCAIALYAHDSAHTIVSFSLCAYDGKAYDREPVSALQEMFNLMK